MQLTHRAVRVGAIAHGSRVTRLPPYVCIQLGINSHTAQCIDAYHAVRLREYVKEKFITPITPHPGALVLPQHSGWIGWKSSAKPAPDHTTIRGLFVFVNKTPAISRQLSALVGVSEGKIMARWCDLRDDGNVERGLHYLLVRYCLSAILNANTHNEDARIVR